MNNKEIAFEKMNNLFSGNEEELKKFVTFLLNLALDILPDSYNLLSSTQ
jgi:hypothetical protein